MRPRKTLEEGETRGKYDKPKVNPIGVMPRNLER